MKAKEIPIRKIREAFYYNEGALISKETNEEVGWNCSGRYLVADFEGKKYLVHRLIWCLFNNEVPDIIDHIDRNSFNNRIENLRASDKSHNGLNSKTRVDNSSGFKGVYKRKDNGKWEVRHKNKYRGYYSTYEEAVKIKKDLLREDGVH